MFKTCVLAVEAGLVSVCKKLFVCTGKFLSAGSSGYKVIYKQVYSFFIQELVRMLRVFFPSVGARFYTLYTAPFTTKTILIN